MGARPERGLLKYAPRFTDWLVLGISVAFTACFVFLLAVGRGGRGGIAGLVFFLMCTGVAVWVLVEKLRMQRSTAALRVEIAGSVPIRSKDSLRWIVGSVFLGAGSVMAWSGAAIGVLFTGCSLVIAAAGALLVVLLATKRVGGQFLMFEPEGLRIAERHSSYLLRWTNLAAIDVSDFNSNPAVRMHVVDADALASTASGTDVESARRAVLRTVEKNRRWAGCDVFLLPYHFGLDAVLFAKAVSGYAADPSRRAALAPKPRLGGA